MNLFEPLAHDGVDIIHGVAAELIVAAVLGALGVLIVGWRSRHQWKSAQFEDRINISLNIVSDGVLRIRTVMEDQLGKIILSPYAQRLLRQAMKRTTEGDEFLHFPTERDGWMVYNEIINVISEACGPHLLALAARRAVFKETRFLMALTYERNKDVRIRKIRVLLVEESVLAHIAEKHLSGDIGVEVENHQLRLQTLKKMHDTIERGTWPQYQTIALPIV